MRISDWSSDVCSSDLLGDLLRAEVLLDRHRIIGAALHRGIVAHDHHLAAGDAADPGDQPGAGHFTTVKVRGGELADFEERRSWIEQSFDAIAGQELAAGDVAVARFLAAA